MFAWAALSGSFVLAQVDFAARRDLSVGDIPQGIAVADLNADGKKDVIVANSSSGTFSVLLGGGNGIFRPQVPKTTLAYPEGLVVASLNSNSDSLLDVAVACSVGDAVQIFLGNGAGGFGAPTNINTGLGSKPIALGITDYNLDGKKDLIVVLYGSSEVRLYSGNGLGGFSLVSTVPVDQGPLGLTVGDWDGDLKDDIAVVSELDTSPDPPPAGKVTVAYGCPTGFCFPVTIDVVQMPTSIASGLLNGDSSPDLVVGSNYVNNVAILYGDPDVGFAFPVTQAVGGHTHQALAIDVNANGTRDLVLGEELDHGQGIIKIYTGNGFGTFTAGASFPIGGYTGGIAASDIGGTSAIDLVTANLPSSSLSLLFGNGSAGFTATPTYAFSPLTLLTALDSGDVTADGKADLVVAQTDLNQVNVLTGSGTGTFSAGAVLTLPGSQPGDTSATGVLLRNFTTDSLLDIVTLNTGPENISLFPGSGPGTFGARTDKGLGNSCNQSSGAGCVFPENLTAGPLNDTDETHPDLVVVNSAGDTSFPNGSLSVFLQTGGTLGNATRYSGGGTAICDGGFAPGITCATNADCRGRCSITTGTLCSVDANCPTGQTCTNPIPGNCVAFPSGVSVGTVDAGTNRDLVVCNSALAKASFLPGNGTGAFPSSTMSSTTGLGPRFPILKDLDGDTDLDLVSLNFGSNSVSSMTGNNTGAFASYQESANVKAPWKGTLADMNVDGWDDLVTNSLTSGAILIALGDGTGRFGVAQRFGSGSGPRDITVADLNGDGKPDMASADEEDGTISIFLNLSQDPLLTITQVAGGTQVSWPPMFEAVSYDVIRGDRALVTFGATTTQLGAVTCIENDSPNTDTVGNEDAVTPPLGTTYFYLFRTQDSQVKGSYGRSLLGKVRVVSSGDCL